MINNKLESFYMRLSGQKLEVPQVFQLKNGELIGFTSKVIDILKLYNALDFSNMKCDEEKLKFILQIGWITKEKDCKEIIYKTTKSGNLYLATRSSQYEPTHPHYVFVQKKVNSENSLDR